MTNEERLALKPGDRVIVQMDDGREVPFTVKYGVWQLGHGAWVVGLLGMVGGYDLERVVMKCTTSDTDSD